ncbi:MAG: transketolase [Actinobacteria bacterium]|nr:transketolase [Actinomycetota bacterium]
MPSLDLVGAYERMSLIRRFEKRCLELAAEGVIAGSVHPCAGQEAIPVGAVAALGETDRVLATYRGHGWALACGVPEEALLAEICQRAEGINGGRGGSAYLHAPQFRFLGENSIVGAGVPIAAGVALAASVQRQQRVALVSVGDGAINQGALHEGLVFAAARALPLVVVCENNGWSEMTPITATVRGSITERVAAYGIDAREVDGCDPDAVHEAVARAVGDARAGAGPRFIECRTVRLWGHYNRDIQHYRPKEDQQAAEAGDPIPRLRQALVASGAATAAELDAAEERAASRIDAATDRVRVMPAPDPATARDHVDEGIVAVTTGAARTAAEPTKEVPYWQAVNLSLRHAMEKDPSVVVFGEDVSEAGGIFGVTRGLRRQFGADRVFDTPIAEAAILGAAVGSALSGLRPVVEIMWADFLLVALDQLVNQAANVRYISRGTLQAPLVVRTQQGVTPGSCAQHSQSLEALLAHIPGLRVGLPSTPRDAYRMLSAAIASNDPVVLIEARSLYQTVGEVDVEHEGIGGARLRRPGSDVGIITWGTQVDVAMEAAADLEQEGLSVAVLDLRWLRPLDVDAIDALVQATEGRVVVCHEANVTGGFGAEVAAGIHERHFDILRGPVRRVATPDVRMPSAPVLQAALVPDAERVAGYCRALVAATAWPTVITAAGS